MNFLSITVWYCGWHLPDTISSGWHGFHVKMNLLTQWSEMKLWVHQLLHTKIFFLLQHDCQHVYANDLGREVVIHCTKLLLESQILYSDGFWGKWWQFKTLLRPALSKTKYSSSPKYFLVKKFYPFL